MLDFLPGIFVFLVLIFVFLVLLVALVSGHIRRHWDD